MRRSQTRSGSGKASCDTGASAACTSSACDDFLQNVDLGYHSTTGGNELAAKRHCGSRCPTVQAATEGGTRLANPERAKIAKGERQAAT